MSIMVTLHILSVTVCVCVRACVCLYMYVCVCVRAYVCVTYEWGVMGKRLTRVIKVVLHCIFGLGHFNRQYIGAATK